MLAQNKFLLHSFLSDLEKNERCFEKSLVTDSEKTSCFANFDAFATSNHHKIDLKRYQNDIIIIFTIDGAAKSHNLKKD